MEFGYVLATRMLVEEKRKVRFFYREEPEGKGPTRDSGWRFFCGDEEQSYVDDPANIGIYDVTTILALDPDVEAYLMSDPGSAFEREDEKQPFRASEGFAPEAEVD